MNNIKIDTTKATDLTKVERIGSHSHIKGLGLSENSIIEPLQIGGGMVGQVKARKAASIIIKLIKQNKISGRGLFLKGPRGTGKTAIAIAMSQELGEDVPFTILSGAEVYSLEMSKVEVITQAIRRSIGIRIREVSEIIEGEVVEVKLEKSFSNELSQNNGFKKGTLTLKTTDMEAVYDLGLKMVDNIYKEKITAGDIITIDKSSSKITKLGRSYNRMRDFDAFSSDTKFIRCPDGELQKQKEITHMINLHEIDVINNSNNGYLGIFSGSTGEIKKEVRETVNWKLNEWKNDGKVDIVPGVLFIDETDLLDLECFSYLNKALEQGCFNSSYNSISQGSAKFNYNLDNIAPVLVFATNKLENQTENYCEIPNDLLDRCLMINTHEYNDNEKEEIVKIRAREEGVPLNENAVKYLVELSNNTKSLRYSILLITTSYFIARRRGLNTVDVDHVKRSFELFLDKNRSISSF